MRGDFLKPSAKRFGPYLRFPPSPAGHDVRLRIGDSTGICWLKKYVLASVARNVSADPVPRQSASLSNAGTPRRPAGEGRSTLTGDPHGLGLPGPRRIHSLHRQSERFQHALRPIR